jgi:hypothetical protein
VVGVPHPLDKLTLLLETEDRLDRANQEGQHRSEMRR